MCVTNGTKYGRETCLGVLALLAETRRAQLCREAHRVDDPLPTTAEPAPRLPAHSQDELVASVPLRQVRLHGSLGCDALVVVKGLVDALVDGDSLIGAIRSSGVSRLDMCARR